jgi:hypothetical protein
MTFFFRFINKRAIYRLGIISLAHAPVHVTDFPVVNVHVDELSSARIWQYKLCATLSANVNINYRLPIKVYYRICTLRHQNRNNSWERECVLSFNMGWLILVWYNLLISANPCWNSKHILASMIYFLIFPVLLRTFYFHIVHNIWKCFILIGWLALTIFIQYTWQVNIPGDGDYIRFYYKK